MCDGDEETGTLFIYLSPDALVPRYHPLLAVQLVMSDSLDKLTADFNALYFQAVEPQLHQRSCSAACRRKYFRTSALNAD